MQFSILAILSFAALATAGTVAPRSNDAGVAGERRHFFHHSGSDVNQFNPDGYMWLSYSACVAGCVDEDGHKGSCTKDDSDDGGWVCNL
ncbi:Uu.00g049900.m01.CDS01 [Anthostomella pinea]|uniref:Uu.00g049900.m01.CDS01 n=1 Tax=Anthostomella pinea TaxID=933095 RepID=A0AAI8VCQ5_9PEZI|nr:Uu.00g049900.m01.CDS01 [Anthostomella pinea]